VVCKLRSIGNGQQNNASRWTDSGGCARQVGGQFSMNGSGVGMLGGGGANRISRRRVARGMPWRCVDRRPWVLSWRRRSIFKYALCPPAGCATVADLGYCGQRVLQLDVGDHAVSSHALCAGRGRLPSDALSPPLAAHAHRT